MRPRELEDLIGQAPWHAEVAGTGFMMYFGHPQWLHREPTAFGHKNRVLAASPRRTYAVIGATNFMASGVLWRAQTADHDDWLGTRSGVMERKVAMSKFRGQVLIDFHIDTATATTSLEFDLGGTLVIEPDPAESWQGDSIWLIENVRSSMLTMMRDGRIIKEPEDFAMTQGTRPV